MKDYSITMQDNSGRTCVVFINSDCIAEQINSGETESNARMSVEDNAVANAIHRGEISSGAWLVATSEVTA
jgi:predicted ABC-type ATPase